VTYKYNGLAETPDDVASGQIRTGLIAQQVQRVAPELVHTSAAKLKPTDAAKTELLEVDYSALTFSLINAVKELKSILDGVIADVRAIKGSSRP
jgi:hypothetical protein